MSLVESDRRTEVDVSYRVSAYHEKISVNKSLARFDAARRSERFFFFDENNVSVRTGVSYLRAAVPHGCDDLRYPVFFEKIECVKNTRLARNGRKRLRNFCGNGHKS